MHATDEFRIRWEALWRGRAQPQATAGDELLSRYSQPHRAYHNVGHILACLDEADNYFRAIAGPVAFPLLAAIFFHDAVYDPQRHDNEAASASWAEERIVPVVSRHELAAIVRLIRATEHKNPPAQPDEILIVDIDLSILGQPEATFDAYEIAIHQEYAHVPDDAFRKGRAAILRRFIDRPRIFATDYFHGQYEAQARINLAQSIRRLQTQRLESP